MSLPTVERLEACMRSTQSLLADLDAADWSVPSLCPGWTVRDGRVQLRGDIKLAERLASNLRFTR